MINFSNHFPRLPPMLEYKLRKYSKDKYTEAFHLFMKVTDGYDESFKKLFPEQWKEIYVDTITHNKRSYNILFHRGKKNWGLADGNDIYIYFEKADKYSKKHYMNILVHEMNHVYRRDKYRGNHNTETWKGYRGYACTKIEFDAEGCAIGEYIRSLSKKKINEIKKNLVDCNCVKLRELCTGRYIEAWESNKRLYKIFLKRVWNEIKRLEKCRGWV